MNKVIILILDNLNDKNDVYVPSSEYSEDNSDEEFTNKRIQQIGSFI